jgi:RNA polymerase sigma factor (sigma-70 family)
MNPPTLAVLLSLFIANSTPGQPLDTTKYHISVTSTGRTNSFFRNDKVWRGADGAASVDLGNGRVLWLFSDGFIAADSSASRKNSKMIRNSVAIQVLDETDKAIMLLYLEEKRYEEIAEITGITKSNVGVRINRAKEILKQNLKGLSHGK